MNLLDIYLETLRRCAPDLLVAKVLRPGMPRTVVAIGKCAGALVDGVGRHAQSAFVAVPEGYRPPRDRDSVELAIGGHPSYNRASFEAGRRLVDFVDAHDDVLFIASGGGSACVERPLAPFTREELIAVNDRVVASGIPIAEINTIRKHLSAIKGGKLARHVRGRCVTLVYSDVSPGRLADVASGPTLPDPTTNDEAARILLRVGGCDDVASRLRELPDPPAAPRLDDDVVLIADNDTLTAAAVAVAEEKRLTTIHWPRQIEDDVETAARALASRAVSLQRGELLVAGGEATVVRRGDGKGGRCCELAVRFALHAPPGISALFGSSDGVDGNSGVAGIEIPATPARLDRSAIETELTRSNSLAAACAIGRPIMIPPAGNNLRDLVLLARP